MILLAALALAAPALHFTERVSRSAPLRVGVIAGPTGGPVDLTAKYREFGIRYVRNNDYYDDRLDIEGILNCGGTTYPSWSGCDASDEKHYSWAASDALMATFRDGGLEPMLRLGGEWQNHDRKHDFKGPQDATQEANWTIAATKVAVRYRYQYAYADIWTEFPGAQFWDRDAASFYPFWVKAYRSVKAAVPEARVGGPGFAMLATKTLLEGGRHQHAQEFLAALYKERIRPDWIGWHIFSSDPTEYAAAGKAYRRLLEGTGEFATVPWAGTGFFSGVELVLDAFGHGRRSEGKEVSQEIQAELMSGVRGAASMAAALVAVSESDTTRAYYYRGNDLGAKEAKGTGAVGAGGEKGAKADRRRPEAGGGEKGAKAERRRPEGAGAGWLGLFDREGAPKPSASVVRLWIRMSDEFPNARSVSDPAGPGVWALASSGEKGTAVFLTNYSDAPIKIDLKDVPLPKPAKSATALFVDDSNDGTKSLDVPVGPLTLAPWQVGMIVFSN